jgi:squalene-associated FAD-dependent desaturase
MPTAIIIGGGLAGLAAATALAPRGFRVTILESRNRLGGRAGSFTDATTGQTIDACQHVSMGCCTNFAHFCKTVGIDHFLATQSTLYFMTPDRRVSRFRAISYPPPLHLAFSFLRAHYLTPGDKLRIAWGLARLMCEPADSDPPFGDWLRAHRQTQRTIDRFWSVVLVSALNESVDRMGMRYARKVFRDAFLGHRRGFEVQVPTVPLGRLYSDELLSWLARHGAEVRLNAAVTEVSCEDNRVTGAKLRGGESMTADVYVVAVPFDRLLALAPGRTEPYFTRLKQLETSPITSVHLWWDRPVMQLPHVVLIDCLGQWVFNRGGSYVQVVVSAARPLAGLGGEEIERRVVEELRCLFPAARDADVLWGRVVTEHAATFSPVPGVDRWRPRPISPIENLFVAGDWTATGWPATMEGAVRSGYLAAESILHAAGSARAILQPDLV